MELVLGAACLGLGAAFVLLLLLIIAKRFLFICTPNEVLIVSGRRQKGKTTAASGFQPIYFGRVWRKPFLEKVDRMDLRTIPIDIHVTNAYSKGGIPLNLHAVANAKVTSNPKYIANAVERFLGRDRAEIRSVAKETLEGHLRGVLARLSPEEVNEDRLKFAEELIDEAETDFLKLGIQLDTLKIQNVSDDTNYLDRIGRARIANVLKEAEIAESNAKADVEQAEASAKQQSDVADQNAETVIIKHKNEFLRLKAEQDALAKQEEGRTVQIIVQARAEAEIKLQEIRQKLEKTRLVADVVLPAQVRKEAQKLQAIGSAAAIVENGKAMAQALELMTEIWLKAGEDAKDIFLIQQLEHVLETVVEKVNAVTLDEVVLLDDSDGKALPSHVASFPAMVNEVLQELKVSTGIDIPGILAGASDTPALQEG